MFEAQYECKVLAGHLGGGGGGGGFREGALSGSGSARRRPNKRRVNSNVCSAGGASFQHGVAL